ncbi:MAG: response regulator [Polyangiaceae bacterium]
MLVVDDDAKLVRAVSGALSDEGREVVCCGDVARVAEVLESFRPDLVLLDVKLPDGDAFSVLEQLRVRGCAPLVVAMSGEATQSEAFRLAQHGVRAYVTKPFTLAELERAIAEARAEPPAIAPHLAQTVGLRPLEDVEREVRDTLVDEALSRSNGSRRGAARLLGISRQLLQHILRRREDR